MQELLKQKEELIKSISELQSELNTVNNKLNEFIEVKAKWFGIDKTTFPNLYSLLNNVKNIYIDETHTLDWGRGKNPVQYNGIRFTFNNIEYSVGNVYSRMNGEDAIIGLPENMDKESWSFDFGIVGDLRTLIDEEKFVEVENYILTLKDCDETDDWFKLGLCYILFKTDFYS